MRSTRSLIPVLLVALLGCDSSFKETPDGEVRDGGVKDGPAKTPDGASPDGEVPECPGSRRSEDVDGTHEPGSYTSIAVESDGTVHVSHYAAGPTPNPFGVGGWHDARYSVRRAGKWSSEDILGPGVVGGFTALGIGPTGKLHTVFYDWAQKDLIYAWNEGSGWKVETMHTTDNDGWANALAVDSSGTVHVVTFKGATGTVNGEWHYLRRIGAKWESRVVLDAPAGGFGPRPGIAAGSDGTVHVSLCNHQGQLKYRSGKDGSFKPALILDTGLGEKCNTSLALDDKGQVHISYHDHSAKTLRYIGQSGSSFGSPKTLDSVGEVGFYNAIATNKRTGDLWVAFSDLTQQDLKVIRRPPGAGWGQPQTVDSAGNVGRYVSAAVGPEDELHVSHLNATAKALRHTRICP
jgi:hypothetical protein